MSTTNSGHAAQWILVVGSVNRDRSMAVRALPLPGETVLASTARDSVGGKGANQAVAAALLNARVSIIGRVGTDENAVQARRDLTALGVDCELLIDDQTAPTGSAFISVDEAGENTIVVHSGANALLSRQDFCRAMACIDDPHTEQPRIALTQGESPQEVVESVAETCRERGIRFIVNLAPVMDLSTEALRLADPLVLNQHEADTVARRLLPGNNSISGVDSGLRLVASLAGTVSESVVITLGALGAVAADELEVWHQPSPRGYAVVDTTGAGDAFTGALTVSLARTQSLREAVRFGVAAGTYATGTAGTTSSYPTRIQLSDVLIAMEKQEVLRPSS